MKCRYRPPIAAVLLLVLAPGVALAADQPTPTTRVADLANVIPDGIERQLTAYLQELDSKTSAQVAVLTVDTTNGVPIEDFAIERAEKWGTTALGLGKKKEDNGVLIVVAVADRRYRIEVGYGLEGTLPDAYCANVAQAYFVPHFKRGRYAQGIYQATAEIADTIAKEKGVTITGLVAPQLARRTAAGSRQHMRRATGGVCSAVAPLVMIVLIFSSMRRRRGMSGWALPMLFGMTLGSSHRHSSWGGGGGGFGGGGFGGFGGGGGSFGGGGASGGW